MDILGVLTAELGVKRSQIEAAVKLIDEGNTIPFIARYRKEVTGSLNDEVLRNLDERLKYLRGLEDRKTQILASIEDQGKLTADLKKKIEEAETMVAVEDLYLPFRPKRKTRASMAKERGLEPLADTILLQMTKEPIETLAARYISEEKGVANVKAVIDGAKDILAERISEVAKYRAYIRNVTKEEGSIVSAAKDEKTESVYEMYYHHEELVRKCAGHRILALNRGEKEKILTVKIAAPEEKILRYLNKMVITRENPVTTPVLQEVIADSYNRLIAPAIEREVRNLMTEKAEERYKEREAMFGDNMREVERVILLRVVDAKWMDHIDSMEQLRQGINLRAYAQRDPVIEYKFEAMDMFEEMIAVIKEETIKYLFHVVPQSQIERQQVAKPVAENLGGDGTVQKKPVVKSERVGRNDPCPCGSGKKYKHCCLGKDEANQ